MPVINEQNINLTNKTQKVSSTHDSGEESEGENEVIEESPDGRWMKRNEPVSQRDIPGIDQAFLAMDTENGFEVVWNEINMSERRSRDTNLDNKLDQIFNTLVNINHPNIVKFHGYWSDEKNKRARIVFITEYMSSGSLKQFLRKAKKTNQPIKKPTWKRWLVQLLTALHYLHNCDPPIIHRELSCDNIYIQHNGLIKIGSIAPDIVHTHVKTRTDNWSKNVHFIAPEILSTDDEFKGDKLFDDDKYGPPVDIYSFGIIALEMFNMDLGGNGDTHVVTKDLVKQSIDSLEDEKQKDFVRLCLRSDPKQRPSALQLLFHPLLFELPTLRLLCSHKFLDGFPQIEELNIERMITNYYAKYGLFNHLNNEMNYENQQNQLRSECFSAILKKNSYEYKLSLNKCIEDLNKYLEDVKSGLYPLTAYLPSQEEIKKEQLLYRQQQKKQQLKQRQPIDPIYYPYLEFLANSGLISSGSQSPIIIDHFELPEKRKAQNLCLQISADEHYEIYTLVITIKFEDKTKRQLEAELLDSDTAISLADELISHGLISEVDKDDLIEVLNQSLRIRNDKLEDRMKNPIIFENANMNST